MNTPNSVIYNIILDNSSELVIKGENGVGFGGSGIAGSNIQMEIKTKNQLDATYYFIVLPISSTCFEHCYAHHQKLVTIMLITTLVVSFLVYCRLEVRCG